ncbi:CotH kinase family protein [Paenibacillus daejeonensis]|uniref:CotH kinase family protein n=1 Tax=Paenibacillus daejeonensis TaxID=135193 RepID=UPI000361B8ED|nr:CotH kinase family protein [Paenibacillus daejeonensis]
MKTSLAKTFATGALAVVLAVTPLGTVGIAPQAYAADAGVPQAYETLFTGDRIIDVNVTIADEDWESILASPLEKDYKSVTVEVDGHVLDNVGFSTKGNSTLRAVASMDDSDRYSFRLKFDKFDKSQTLLGLDKMVLNNNYSDPSYLREYLHYEALRLLGMDAPQTVFANLYINGELFGFYTGVESVDDSYLLRNYGEDYKEGVLYEAEQGTTLLYEEDGAYETLTEDLGSDPDKALLRQFIETLNSMPDGEQGDIESVLHVDSALQYIAANMVLGNYDSYNGSMGHNFMLYSDADGLFSVVPWDFNMSFNGFMGGGGRAGGGTSQTSVTAVTVPVDEPVLGIDMARVPLINNLLQVPEYKTKYLSYVSELVSYLAGIEDRVAELADLIRPSVTADPTAFYTVEQFESNLVYDPDEQVSGMGMFGGGLGMTPPEGMENWTPPGDFEGMTPPEGWEGGLPQGFGSAEGSGSRPGERPWDGMAPGEGGAEDNGWPGGGMGGGGLMTAGSLVTFALNRLANLQEQLGLEVIDLPQGSESSGAPVEATEESGSEGDSSSSAGDGIQVTLDGQRLSFAEQQPLIREGQLYVPLRTVVTALGGSLAWDSASRTTTATFDDTAVIVAIDQLSATVAGQAFTLQATPIIINGRTMVPVRFLAEALGRTVSWNPTTQHLVLSKMEEDAA